MALTLYVKTLSGDKYKFEASPQDSILSAKLQIWDCTRTSARIPPQQQNLIYAGRTLQDTRTLQDCHIADQATLHLVLRLRGCDKRTYYVRSGPAVFEAFRSEQQQTFAESKKQIFDRFAQHKKMRVAADVFWRTFAVFDGKTARREQSDNDVHDTMKCPVLDLKSLVHQQWFGDVDGLAVKQEEKQLNDEGNANSIDIGVEKKENETEIEDLRRRLETERTEKMKYEQMLREKDDENKALQQQLEAVKTENKEQKMRLLFLDEQLSRVQEEHKQTQMELQRLKRMKNIDTSTYLQWTSDDVVDWVLSLEDGVFSVYEDTIRGTFKEEEVKGTTIHMLDKFELRGLGIKTVPHRTLLLQHIQKLIQQNPKQGNGNQNDNNNQDAEGTGNTDQMY